MARWISDETEQRLRAQGRLHDVTEKRQLAREWNGNVDTRGLANCEFVTATSGGTRTAIVAPQPSSVGRTPLTLNVAAGGTAIKPVPVASFSPTVAASSATPKFRNVKTNGYASKREADRAAELKLLEQAGEILGLLEQVPFEVIPKQDGERPCKYIADFTYTTKRGEYVVEDTKGVKTADYIVKRKLMLHVHGIRVKEV